MEHVTCNPQDASNVLLEQQGSPPAANLTIIRSHSTSAFEERRTGKKDPKNVLKGTSCWKQEWSLSQLDALQCNHPDTGAAPKNSSVINQRGLAQLKQEPPAAKGNGPLQESALALCSAPALATISHFGKQEFSEAQVKCWLPDIHPGERGLYASGPSPKHSKRAWSDLPLLGAQSWEDAKTSNLKFYPDFVDTASLLKPSTPVCERGCRGSRGSRSAAHSSAGLGSSLPGLIPAACQLCAPPDSELEEEEEKKRKREITFQKHEQFLADKMTFTGFFFFCMLMNMLTDARSIQDGDDLSREAAALPYWPFSSNDFWSYVEYFRTLGAYSRIDDMARAFFAQFPFGSHLGYHKDVYSTTTAYDNKKPKIIGYNEKPQYKKRLQTKVRWGVEWAVTPHVPQSTACSFYIK
ncbi:hypothetical protein IHE44_0001770 [Lamprotornis superbus]|uniref:Uncharacterized protein n=3 Tax=Passeriformes TaxID=9126 RepID=A0A835NN95_9PASS|nr:hypothetical protein IHE44_0001770 [Lamprotornis superbus]